MVNSQPILSRKEAAIQKEKNDAKLILQEPSVELINSSPSTHPVTHNYEAQNAASKQAPKTGLGSLNSIRQKIALKNKAGDIDVKLLTEEDLHSCWGQFIDKLRSRKNHAAVTNFKDVELAIIDNNIVEIAVKGDFQKAFIEEERADLINHLQEHFNNRLLVYQVAVREQEQNAAPVQAPLTRKEQYFKIIEEYPLVKELRDRLKLELE